MANYRVGRVRQEIMREVNRILLREAKDPRIEGVTITDVNIFALKSATRCKSSDNNPGLSWQGPSAESSSPCFHPSKEV